MAGQVPQVRLCETLLTESFNNSIIPYKSAYSLSSQPKNDPADRLPVEPTNLNLLHRDLNRLDNAKSAKATDALLNYETVKYFSNEAHERTQFAVAIGDYQRVEYLLLASLSALNIVQSLIIFVGLAAGLTVCANVRIFPPTFPVSSTPQLVVREGLKCATLSEHSHGCVHYQLFGPILVRGYPRVCCRECHKEL